MINEEISLRIQWGLSFIHNILKPEFTHQYATVSPYYYCCF